MDTDTKSEKSLPNKTVENLGINDLLEQLKKSKINEIKAEKVSSKATVSSRMNIEQTASLKRFKLYLILGLTAAFVIFIIYCILSAYTEYHDIVTFINTYGPGANVPISGLKMALCLRYPPLTSWFLQGNTSFPEAVFIAYRTAQFHDAFVKTLPDNLQELYGVAISGCSDGDSENTSAAYLICCTSWASNGGKTSCEDACNSTNSTNTTSSVLSGLNMGISTAVTTSEFFPPFGFIAGMIGGFCAGFFTSQYPPGASDSLNHCIT